MQLKICILIEIPRENIYLCYESHQRQFLSYVYILQRCVGFKDHKTAVVAAGMKNNYTVIMQKHIIEKRKHHC